MHQEKIPDLGDRAQDVWTTLALLEVAIDGLLRTDADASLSEDVLRAMQGQCCRMRTVTIEAIERGLDMASVSRMPAPEGHQWDQALAQAKEEKRHDAEFLKWLARQARVDAASEGGKKGGAR